MSGRLSAFSGRPDGGGVVDGPVFDGCAFEECWSWIDGEGPAGDGEHVRVVDGVAEDCVGCGEADTGECGDFAFVGGDIDERIGDEAVGDRDLCGEDSVCGDVEALDTFFDDPVAGGADGPYFGSGGLEVADEGQEFGEDVALDLRGEEFGGRGAHVRLAEAAVDLDHFAADVEFGDLACEIAFVAEVEACDGFGREDSAVDGPAHEA